jgi:MbtH protein
MNKTAKTNCDPAVANVGLGVRYCVVINHEEQYSIWPLSRLLPAGWQEVRPSVQGERDMCLKYIDTVWLDIRPKSLCINLCVAGTDAFQGAA